MARSLFAGRPGDSVISLFSIGSRRLLALPVDANGDPTNVVLTVWDAPAGTQLTDLRAADGVTPITQVVVPSSTGQIPEFYGPDGVNVALYVKDPDGDYQRIDARADSAAIAAVDAQAAAEAARDAALDAQAAAEAVGATTDAQVGNSLTTRGLPTSGTALSASMDYRSVRALSPLDPTYGAVGDDTADDLTHLQAVITAGASFGIPVDLRGHTYKTTDTLTIPAGSVVQNGAIHCTATGKTILDVTGSNVALRKLSVIGRHATADGANGETGIYARGASAAAPISGLLLEDCSVELVGKTGLMLEHVNGYRVLRCDLGDIGYAGIGHKSALNGLIDGCRIDNIPGDNAVFGSTNAYGLHISRYDEIADLTTAPRSENITVSNCIISNVPTWEGLDTHGGKRITFINNIVTGCRMGIMVGNDDPSIAPLGVIVQGNIIDSLVTDGSTGAGIVFQGAQGATGSDPAIEYATGAVIGNTIRNHGPITSTTNGAIHLHSTMGVAVHGNVVEQPGTHGIVLYYDNRGVSVVGNIVHDPWSNTNVETAAIAVRSANNTGTITGNTLVDTGARAAATYKNRYGLYSSGLGATVDMFVGGNSFTAATVASISDVSTGSRVRTKFLNPILAGANQAGTPAYSFDGDPDTGFYNSGADQIGVSVGGTSRGRFLTTGWLAASAYNWDCAGGVVTAVHKDVKSTPTFAAAQTVSWSATNFAVVTLTANMTSLTFSNPNSDTVYELHLVQDATGSRTLAGTASNIKWAGGTAPTLTTTGGKRDIFRFRYDGTNYYEISRTMNLG